MKHRTLFRMIHFFQLFNLFEPFNSSRIIQFVHEVRDSLKNHCVSSYIYYTAKKVTTLLKNHSNHSVHSQIIQREQCSWKVETLQRPMAQYRCYCVQRLLMVLFPATICPDTLYLSVGTALALNYSAMPLLFELAAEALYPIDETASAAFLTGSLSFVGVVYVSLAVVPGVGVGDWMNYALLICVAASIPILLLCKIDYRRSAVDDEEDQEPARDQGDGDGKESDQQEADFKRAVFPEGGLTSVA